MATAKKYVVYDKEGYVVGARTGTAKKTAAAMARRIGGSILPYKLRNPSLATTLKRDVWVPAKVMVTKAGKILAKVTSTAMATPRHKNGTLAQYRSMDGSTRYQAKAALERELRSDDVTDSRIKEILAELAKIRAADKPAKAKKAKSGGSQYMNVLGGYALDKGGKLVGHIMPDGRVVDRQGKPIGHTDSWEPGSKKNSRRRTRR